MAKFPGEGGPKSEEVARNVLQSGGDMQITPRRHIIIKEPTLALQAVIEEAVSDSSVTTAEVVEKNELRAPRVSVRGQHERALERLRGQSIEPGVRELYPHQEDFLGKFADYFEQVVESRRGSEEPVTSPRMARIEAAPRTGKTTMAAEMIRRTDLRAVFFVPTTNLREQSAREFTKLLPGKKIAIYTGDEAAIADADIIVSNYQMGQADVRVRQGLPVELRSLPLIFADEGHESTTDNRLEMMRDHFDSDSIRIALSGTPDYSAPRKLEDFYPDLIHKITTPEAVKLGLLSPVEYWVYEVDVDASKVEMRAGDYPDDEIGRIMTGFPIFKTLEHFRYHPGDPTMPDRTANKDIPALVCFRTKQQVADAHTYLKAVRPEEAGRIAVVTEDTPNRQQVLDDYAAGKYDTLLTVRVLLTGWDSERCKLLLDFDPSTSPVRSGQKYTRPLTKSGPDDDRISRIYSFIPAHLRYPPLLPPDILKFKDDADLPPGSIIGKTRKPVETKPRPIQALSADLSGVKVTALTNLREYGNLELLDLDRENSELLKEIIQSGHTGGAEVESAEVWLVDILRSYRNFQNSFFQHPAYTGQGRTFLWSLGIKSPEEFQKFVSRTFPDQRGTLLLIDQKGWRMNYTQDRRKAIKQIIEPGGVAEDVERYFAALEKKPHSAEAQAALQIFFGPHFRPTDEERRTDPLLFQAVQRVMSTLSKRERAIVTEHVIEDKTFLEIGKVLGISSESARKRYESTIGKIRRRLESVTAPLTGARRDIQELLGKEPDPVLREIVFRPIDP